MRAAIAALAVTAAACVPTAPAPTTTLSTLAPVTSVETTLPVVAAYEVSGCTNAPPRAWSTLCRGHQLLSSRHIDAPEPSALAAAAVAGVRRLDAREADVAEVTASVSCVIPHLAFEPVCEAISERHHLERVAVDALVEAAVQGMFRLGLDPFSAYVTPDFADRLDALGSGQVLSIGMIVGARDGSGGACGPIGDGCELTVLAVFDFGPAERSGVTVGDVILSIDGVPTSGQSEAEAVAALHAPPGVATEIVVPRSSGLLTKDLEHEDLRYDVVEYAMLTPDVAYVRLNDFSQDAARLFGQVLAFDEVAQATGMILDVRDNPGGLVMSAMAVVSQFVHDGLVLVEQTRDRTIEVPVIAGGLVSPAVDLVVLTNRGTASAAEVVAAALQARGRALVVGEPTFGKDLIQEVFRAPNGGEFRISVSRWVAPDGRGVGVSGLSPDVFVQDRHDADSDDILFAAFDLLNR